MGETPPNQEHEKFDPSKLHFSELQAAYELAHTTFKETEDGFVSIDGDIISIEEEDGKYKIIKFPSSSRRQKFHFAVLNEPFGEIIRNGSADKNKVVNALKQLITTTGSRIIE